MIKSKKRPTVSNKLTLTRFHNNHASDSNEVRLGDNAELGSNSEGAQNKDYSDGVHRISGYCCRLYTKSEDGVHRLIWGDAQISGSRQSASRLDPFLYWSSRGKCRRADISSLFSLAAKASFLRHSIHTRHTRVDRCAARGPSVLTVPASTRTLTSLTPLELTFPEHIAARTLFPTTALPAINNSGFPTWI
jgi:hypothetical protein